MKPDEVKRDGRTVIKGVMDPDDLDVGQPGDEKVPEFELEDRRADEAEEEWSKPLPKE